MKRKKLFQYGQKLHDQTATRLMTSILSMKICKN